MNKPQPILYCANWILPVATPPFRNGAVLVTEEGTIAAVGPRAAIEPPPEAMVIELGEAALLPGLVNVHAHPELSVYRGLLEEIPFHQWILELVGSKRAALGEEDFLAASLWTAVEAIRGGITTIAGTESSSSGLSALRQSGLRGIIYHEVFGPDPRQVDSAMSGLRDAVAELRPGETDLVRLGVSPHAPYTVSDQLFAASTRFARDNGLPMAIHIAESRQERDLVLRGEGEFATGLRARAIATPARGTSPIELLDRLGVLAAHPLLIHCVDLDGRDIERIAAAGCTVAHCPAANAKLGHGIAPVIELRDAGVTVGLGTDSVASNNRLDLLEEARVASLMQRGFRRSWEVLSAGELLTLCTLDGARALGFEARVGTLETGKDADLCAVSFAGPHVKPVHDPVAALFHSARASDVILTVVRGRVLQRDGRVLTLDVGDVETRVEDAAARLRELR